MARVRRNDWIQTGLSLLATEGEQALTVHRLCDAMGKTTGSYYHHFKDHGGFRRALLEYWAAKAAMRFGEVAEQSGDPKQRQQALEAMVHGLDLRLERALRIWAWREPDVHGFLQEIDQQRLDFLTCVYRDAGAEEKQADQLAQIDYGVLVGALMLTVPIKPDQLTEAWRGLIWNWLEHSTKGQA